MDNFSLSIVVNGEVKNELANGQVNLPFGTEYSVRLTNNASKNAVVKLFIDGTRMCRGGFIIPPNSFRDIECSSATQRKFKFIDLKSSEAKANGKDQVNLNKEMGLVLAQFHLEKEKPAVQEVQQFVPHCCWHNQTIGPGLRTPNIPSEIKINADQIPTEIKVDWAPLSSLTTPGFPEQAMLSNVPVFPPIEFGPPPELKTMTCSIPYNPEPAYKTEIPTESHIVDADYCCCFDPEEKMSSRQRKKIPEKVSDGATVQGGYSNQKFGILNLEYEENYVTLKLFLQGYSDPFPVRKNYCSSCGVKTYKSNNFCHNCGSEL